MKLRARGDEKADAPADLIHDQATLGQIDVFGRNVEPGHVVTEEPELHAVFAIAAAEIENRPRLEIVDQAKDKLLAVNLRLRASAVTFESGGEDGFDVGHAGRVTGLVFEFGGKILGHGNSAAHFAHRSKGNGWRLLFA